MNGNANIGCLQIQKIILQHILIETIALFQQNGQANMSQKLMNNRFNLLSTRNVNEI